MARSSAATVSQYLAELPEERRAVVAAVRDLIVKHLPAGYQESMNWGMICYEVPLSRYSGVAGGQPLMYLGLAAQKHSYTLHVMSAAGPEQSWLKREFEKAGKKLDMGKACIHFRTLDDLPLESIGALIARTPVAALVGSYEASRTRTGK